MPKPNGSVVDFTLLRSRAWILDLLDDDALDALEEFADGVESDVANENRPASQADLTAPPSRMRQALDLWLDDAADREISALLPPEYESLVKGRRAWIDNEELGLHGMADVVFVGPCPDFEPAGPPLLDRSNRPLHRRLVTGTYRHTAFETLEIAVDGESRRIRATPNHPFWSEDRLEFVAAEELKPGERLRTSEGASARVTSLRRRPEPVTVHNLEIDGEHVYFVGDCGLLVHNSYKQKAIKNSEPKHGKTKNGMVKHEDPKSGKVKSARESELDGDHVLPEKAFRDAKDAYVKNGGVIDDELNDSLRGLQDGADNLRPMKSGYNRSKGARNTEEFAQTPYGQETSRKYLKKMEKIQRDNAKKLHKLLGGDEKVGESLRKFIKPQDY